MTDNEPMSVEEALAEKNKEDRFADEAKSDLAKASQAGMKEAIAEKEEADLKALQDRRDELTEDLVEDDAAAKAEAVAKVEADAEEAEDEGERAEAKQVKRILEGPPQVDADEA